MTTPGSAASHATATHDSTITSAHRQAAVQAVKPRWVTSSSHDDDSSTNNAKSKNSPSSSGSWRTPSLQSIMAAFNREGNGDRQMLLAILEAKKTEDERLRAADALKVEHLRAHNNYVDELRGSSTRAPHHSHHSRTPHSPVSFTHDQHVIQAQKEEYQRHFAAAFAAYQRQGHAPPVTSSHVPPRHSYPQPRSALSPREHQQRSMAPLPRSPVSPNHRSRARMSPVSLSSAVPGLSPDPSAAGGNEMHRSLSRSSRQSSSEPASSIKTPADDEVHMLPLPSVNSKKADVQIYPQRITIASEVIGQCKRRRMTSDAEDNDIDVDDEGHAHTSPRQPLKCRLSPPANKAAATMGLRHLLHEQPTTETQDQSFDRGAAHKVSNTRHAISDCRGGS